jgi:hypothetical protein
MYVVLDTLKKITRTVLNDSHVWSHEYVVCLHVDRRECHSESGLSQSTIKMTLYVIFQFAYMYMFLFVVPFWFLNVKCFLPFLGSLKKLVYWA